MIRAPSRRRLLAGIGATALSTTAGCGWIERDERSTFQRAYESDDLDEFAVETETGDLTVRGRGRDRISVQGERLAASEEGIDALSVTAVREEDRLELDGTVDDGPWPLGWWRRPVQHLDVAVPPSVRVDRAATDGGDLEVRNVSGPLEAECDTGDCHVADVDGSVDVRTDTGSLVVQTVTGPITARADTGDVTVDGEIGGLRTDTGDVSATVRAIAGEPTVAADTGDVDVALDPSLDVTVDVAVDTGSIGVHGGDDASIQTAEQSGTIVLGEGSGTLAIETDTGDVSITILE